MRELSEEQALALASPAAESLVIAAAGSGKTTLLIARVFWALQQSSEGEVVALTFTERAAEEMAARATAQAQKAGAATRRDFSRRARLTTIDGFCLSLLYDDPLFEQWPGARLVPPEDLNAFARAHAFEIAAGVVDAARALDAQSLEEAVIEACDLLRLRTKRDLVSTALVDRFRARYRRDVALWATQLAAPETLQAAIAAEAARLQSLPLPLLDTLLAYLHRQRLGPGGNQARDALRALAKRSDALFAPASAVRRQALEEIVAVAERVLDGYQAWKRAHDAFDFVDLERTALALLDNPACKEDVQARLSHLLIDEVQDTNPLQEQLLAALGSEAAVFRVGDPRQAIYGFRDAEVEGILERRRQLPADACFELSINHRSQPPILALANDVWRALSDEAFAPMRASRSGETPVTLHVVDKKEGEPTLVTESEATVAVAQRVLPETRKDLAILCRSGFQAAAIFEAATRAAMPVYWRARRRLSDLSETDDVCALLAFFDEPDNDLALYAAMRSGAFGASLEEVAALHRLAHGLPALPALPRVPLTPRAERGRQALLACLRERHLPRAALLARFLSASESPLAPYAILLAKLGDLDALRLPMNEAVERLREGYVEHDLGDPEGCRIMTIHAAKGLEWPTVLVPFCGSRFDRQMKDVILSTPGGGAALLGPWPDDAATTALEWQMRERGREEEHRLLYVALTRARDALHLIGLRKKREVTGPPRAQSSFVNVLRAMYEFDYPETEQIRVGPLAVRLVTGAS